MRGGRWNAARTVEVRYYTTHIYCIHTYYEYYILPTTAGVIEPFYLSFCTTLSTSYHCWCSFPFFLINNYLFVLVASAALSILQDLARSFSAATWERASDITVLRPPPRRQRRPLPLPLQLTRGCTAPLRRWLHTHRAQTCARIRRTS